MKPIIFARLTDMKYYKGITDDDKPVNGGSFVKDTNLAHECYNFDVVTLENGKEYCLGFVEISTGAQLCIERIIGCESFKNAEYVDNVTVVFCSKPGNIKGMRVVGFYRNATVFRYPQSDDDDWIFNFISEKKNCVLLPYQERLSSDNKWFVPISGTKGYTFGFGRSNTWYAESKTDNKDEIEYFLNKLINNIENYDGDNLV
ncbi:MAG: hypothetical protein K2H93_07500 [Oscillospiraceae bacterium]|nr:hypothetical protein [Oscillospiraceae bacterium]